MYSIDLRTLVSVLFVNMKVQQAKFHGMYQKWWHMGCVRDGIIMKNNLQLFQYWLKAHCNFCCSWYNYTRLKNATTTTCILFQGLKVVEDIYTLFLVVFLREINTKNYANYQTFIWVHVYVPKVQFGDCSKV